jgi:hypothetical protein
MSALRRTARSDVHFAMPQAVIVRDETVDYIRPVTEIAALIEKLVALLSG